MSKTEVIGLIVTIISLLCFSVVFTVLFSSYCKGQISEVKSGKKDIELLDIALQEKLQKKEDKKPNKKIKIIKNVLSYSILILLIGLFSMTLYSNITGDLTPVFDKAVITIKTGSMSYVEDSNKYIKVNGLTDQFNAYDMLIVERPTKDNVDLYDVIAYRDNEGDTIVHRIVKIDTIDGETRYHTRGDAVKYNENSYDPFISSFDDIVGVYTGNRIPYLGLIVLFLQSYSGLVTVFAVIYCIYMFSNRYGKLKDECYKRIDVLLSLIKDPLKLDEFKMSYIQCIYYHGFVYEFLNGKFVRKVENGLINDDKNVYVISQDASDDVKLEISDVEHNRILELSDDESKETIEKIKKIRE